MFNSSSTTYWADLGQATSLPRALGFSYLQNGAIASIVIASKARYVRGTLVPAIIGVQLLLVLPGPVSALSRLAP